MAGPPWVRITGPHNSGKTALVEALVRELTARGLRIGTIKRAGCQFDLDHPGKDTWRHRQAGAVATIIYSDDQLALVQDISAPPELPALVAQHFADCDLVLAEGRRLSEGPEIRLGESSDDGADIPVAALPKGYDLPEDLISSLADRLQELISRPAHGQ